MSAQKQSMPRTILIIDDNEDDVLLMELAFARNSEGVKIESTSTGKAGIALLTERNSLPDLILLDISMPGMNGFDVLRHLQSDDRLRAIPVVIVSHSGLVADVMSSFEFGATAFLQKASDFEKFVGDVRMVLDRITSE